MIEYHLITYTNKTSLLKQIFAVLGISSPTKKGYWKGDGAFKKPTFYDKFEAIVQVRSLRSVHTKITFHGGDLESN